MRFGSLFTGIGGFDLGLERAGWECRWQVENDARCNEVLEARFPGVRRYEDVREVGPAELAPVDLVCGGFPCQDLSVAGKRRGLAGERSGLWEEFRRVVSELRPRWVLVENVPGLLSSHGGRDMGALLGGLGQLGYRWAYRVLDSQYFGVAQRRRRVFIVGCAGGGSPAEVLFDAASLQRNPPTSTATRERIARGSLSRALSRVGGGDDPGANKGAPIVTPTLTAPDTNAPMVDGKRQDGSRQDRLPITVVPPLLAGANSTGGDRPPGTTVDTAESLVVPALTAKMAKGTGGPAGDEAQNLVVEAFNVYPEGGQGADLRAEPTDLSMSLNPAAEERRTDRGTRIVAYRKAQKAHDPEDCERWERDDHSDTLSGHGTGTALAIFEPRLARNDRGAPEEVCPPLKAESGRTGKGDSAPHLLASRPRRLTPRECERLQGFPDDWTLVNGMADGPRYRMLGNAVTVQVAEWIGRRMLGC